MGRVFEIHHLVGEVVRLRRALALKSHDFSYQIGGSRRLDLPYENVLSNARRSELSLCWRLLFFPADGQRLAIHMIGHRDAE